jgi:putative restriction endonuclease
VSDNLTLRIPDWVADLATFRRWVKSDAVPEKGRVCYLGGEVWVDVSGEQVFSHNLVKQAFNLVLGGLVAANRLGRYHPDGVLLTNAAADLSSQPDGLFVSHASRAAGRLRAVAGARSGFTELEGTPEMVLEVVSDSSVEKDTITLPVLYWRAGIPEYWLVDARGERPTFGLLKRGAKGYTAVRQQSGWVKSSVFGRSFRLTRGVDEFGDPEFTLDVR